jgi:small subunit ribosomal protein S25e
MDQEEESADKIAGTRSNRRQEAKEEVVKGQGYVIPHHSHTAPPHRDAIFDALGYAQCNPPHTLHRTRAPSRPLTRSATDNHVVKDKANHAVVLDKQTNDKLQKDVQSYRLITVATLVDRLKINGSLARQALNDLEANGQIKKVVGHSKLNIYSTSPASRSCREFGVGNRQRLTRNSTSGRRSRISGSPRTNEIMDVKHGCFFQLFDDIPLLLYQSAYHDMNGSHYIGHVFMADMK